MAHSMLCALIYDFDGTLAEGDCAQHGVMPALNVKDVDAFWKEVKAVAKRNDGDEILSYMGLLAAKARDLKSSELSASNLKKHGASIPLFPGVESWFERINGYAAKLGISLEHYIISSGLEKMIEGTSIGHHFKKIFACKYEYNKDESSVTWPALAINYTTKTQYLFRINKGIDNCYDNDAVNKFIEPKNRKIPFERMIYFGDGDTDIPSMKMVRYQGGTSLGVFNTKKWDEPKTQEKVGKLIAEERANYVVPADYQEGSQLDVTVKGILQLIKRKSGTS